MAIKLLTVCRAILFAHHLTFQPRSYTCEIITTDKNIKSCIVGIADVLKYE